VTRILIVEDETGLAGTLRMNLSARGYDVGVAHDGATALDSALSRPPDLVILDLGLPDMDGTAVIHGLRASSLVPVVVLSARESQEDKVEALDAGADDYLTKPFGMDELLARVRAALRRAEPADAEPVITLAAFTIDLAAKRVTREGHLVRLTPTEWHLLELLANEPGRLVSREHLLTEVWGPTYARQSNYLRVYMAQLRQKLEPDPSHPRHILTEAGMGYRLEP
jgi:two-component system KDP operon response regulator KdpE